RRRDQARGDPAEGRAADAGGSDDERAVVEDDETAAEDRAEQKREEGAGFDQRVAGDELVRVEMLRQQRVLDRAEDGRMRAEAEQRDEQQRKDLQPQARP